MLIEISIGEGLDRLSILDIKLSKITTPDKLEFIRKEMDSLKELFSYKIKYSYYYNLLVSVNTQIWEFTDAVKTMNCETFTFGKLADSIFNLNQSRFRLKNIITRLTDSSIQEQKSYNSTSIEVILDQERDIDVGYFTNLSLEYDIVIIKCNDSTKLRFIDKVPVFNYSFIT